MLSSHRFLISLSGVGAASVEIVFSVPSALGATVSATRSETGTVSNPTADKTYAAIKAQLDAGAPVYVKLNDSVELIPLTSYTPAIVAGETGSVTFSKEYAPDPTEPDEKLLVSITLTDAGSVSARKVTVTNTR